MVPGGELDLVLEQEQNLCAVCTPLPPELLPRASSFFLSAKAEPTECLALDFVGDLASLELSPL